ncbi:uncharacterized protein LOC117554319 [Gymnodraco acuticeps]|uniref:Uncharacterized protein LOC117554319 n=1 Tax=Gymnodraco acuticeps TaxID=8218 RepID=A0A6P8V4P0_GYMAC|nr:uncharacterized protein LOC117554319 [Gymnodraco acuticeps]
MFAYVKYTDGFKACSYTYNKHPKLQPKNISSGHPLSHSLGIQIFQRPGFACERSATLEDSKAELEGEVTTYRTANLNINLDKLLNQVFSQKEQSEIPEQREPAPWTPTHPNNSPSKSEPHGKEQGEIPVRPEVWAKIKNNTRDSMFVKELAVVFWGTDTLGERSLTGKECPTTKTTRQPLTICFKQWLYEKYVEDQEMLAGLAKTGRYITEKIMDINKKKKKKLKKKKSIIYLLLFTC